MPQKYNYRLYYGVSTIPVGKAPDIYDFKATDFKAAYKIAVEYLKNKDSDVMFIMLANMNWRDK